MEYIALVPLGRGHYHHPPTSHTTVGIKEGSHGRSPRKGGECCGNFDRRVACVSD